MGLAELRGVSREGFLRQYQGSELDPRWLNCVSKLAKKGWKNFAAQDKQRERRSTRSPPRQVSRIAEFRKIIHMVRTLWDREPESLDWQAGTLHGGY
jgi:RNA polymerase primary sigma factor